MKQKDTYTILGIEEKTARDFSVAYAVNSEDIPRFKLMLTVPISNKEDIIGQVNFAAFEQLRMRRAKTKKAEDEQAEAARIEIAKVDLIAAIMEVTGTETTIKKPAEKKPRLEAPKETPA